MEIKRILVIGGSGFIGKTIINNIKNENKIKNNNLKYDIACLDRKLNSEVKTIIADLLNKKEIIDLIKEYDIIIYLAGIVRTIKKNKYMENIRALENTIEAMQKNNIKNLIFFSTQNVHIQKTGHYGNSKKESEKIIKNSDLDYMIIRPNYVYDINKNNDFYKLIKIIKKFKICSIIGQGNNLMQPINKKDIGAIIANLIKKKIMTETKIKKNYTQKREFDISGSTTISLNEIVEIIRQKLKMKFIIIKIPIFLVKPFKFMLPFDIEGYDKNRLAKENIIKGKSNFREDLYKIIELK